MTGDFFNTVAAGNLPWGGLNTPQTFLPIGAANIQVVPPSPPAPSYTFNIVILANGKNIPLDTDDLATKIGLAIAAAFETKEAQEMVEELAE